MKIKVGRTFTQQSFECKITSIKEEKGQTVIRWESPNGWTGRIAEDEFERLRKEKLISLQQG